MCTLKYLMVVYNVITIYKCGLPQILSGASSSNKIGCCKNISLDFKQSPRTSDSVIATIFPGRHPRTVINMESVL